MLLVVGRGASDPDANSNISKITRLLWEGIGFGLKKLTPVFFPLVSPPFRRLFRLDKKNYCIPPFFIYWDLA
ncbi:MAG: hypothetical protein CM15mP73_1600 [Hyphomicrobiales bacterium]|nr:MAG: hypothetical protein CM15mP73_1600 [Hyphomicrobiales bacterium]